MSLYKNTAICKILNFLSLLGILSNILAKQNKIKDEKNKTTVNFINSIEFSTFMSTQNPKRRPYLDTEFYTLLIKMGSHWIRMGFKS